MYSKKVIFLQYLIGVDVGTTNLKALAFDTSGVPRANASASTPTQPLPNGGAQYDTDELWGLIASLLRKLAAALPGGTCSGLAVTGMGEAGVPLDADGGALYPAIAWFDPRTAAISGEWARRAGAERLLHITGLRAQHIFTVNKLLWLRAHEPEVFSHMSHWHCLPDFIAYRLTGVSVMDRSIASRTMLLDQARGDWSDELLTLAGIPRRLLPAVADSGAPCGRVTREAAALTGLPEGLPVFTGGHDHICGALACGVFSPQVVLDSSGTCEEVLVPLGSFAEAAPLGCAGFNVGCHTAPGMFYAAGGIPASGASVDWYTRQFPASGGSVPGADGLLFLPHLRGGSSPARSPASKGAFVGLRASHSPDDLAQAVYEGVAFEMRRCMERLLNGAPPARVLSIGGGTKNARWLQIKADVLGVPIEVPAVQEASALGAALLAGVGAGVFRDVRDAVSKTYCVGTQVRPASDATAVYNRLYPLYETLEPVLHDLNAALEPFARQKEGL